MFKDITINMMKYHFIPQDDRLLEFIFFAPSFDAAVEELNGHLKNRDAYWETVKHSNGEFGVDLFLKEKFVETLLVSESPLGL